MHNSCIVMGIKHLMLMKKLYALVAGLCCLSATAQEFTVIEEQPNTSISGFATNRFWDNWELQGGAGFSFMLGTGSTMKNAWQGVGYIAAGKWIHPVFGMRIGGEGGKINYLNTAESKVNTSYLFIHPDLMVNLCNWIGGYQDYRVYDAVLTAGAGVAMTSLNHKATRQTEFAASVGLQNRFNINTALSIDLTVNYALARATLFPQIPKSSSRFNALTCYVGVTYRFNKRNFNRISATDEEVAAMLAMIAEAEAEAAEAKAENAKLLKINAEQQNQLERATVKISEISREVVTDEAVMERIENPIQAANAKEAIESGNYNELLFYLYGYGILSADNKARLDLLADHINKSHSDRIFRIEGFADPQTGTEKCNMKLAAKRARLAYDYLISKGVDPAKLEWINGGTTNLPFNHKEQNRVVVIF